MADAIRDKWNQEAKKLIGRQIVDVRYMSPERADDFGWYWQPVVLILDDGTALVPSSDDEGNGPGVLFHQGKDGKQVAGFPVLR